MRIRATFSQLVAALVLLLSACDYCAFDMYDSEASMSQAVPVLFRSMGHTVQIATVRTIDLPDDHCLWCSPSIASQAAILESPFLISSNFEIQANQPLIPEALMIERQPKSVTARI
jgi:hypothetical protein